MHEKGIDEYSDEDVSVFVVWQNLFSADSEPAAIEAHRTMSMHRVFQFWDPEMQSGIAYSNETYPAYVRDLAEALPADHELKDAWMARRGVSPERLPMWNFAAFYPPGVTWGESPPLPAGMIKLLVVGSGAFDPSDPHLYFVDDFANPPVHSNWYDLVELQMERLMKAHRD